MQPTQHPVTGSTVTPARTLRDTALYLARYGWIQGAYYDASGGSFTPPACLVGAIGMVCYGGPVDAPAHNYDDPGFGDFEPALAWLERHLADVHDIGDAFRFNDAKGRTAEQVIAVLNAAAERWEETHCPQSIQHGDYPHYPGTLYDCRACEANCFCTDGVPCVYCALVSEPTTEVVGGAS